MGDKVVQSPFEDGMFLATTRHLNLRAQAHLTDVDALVTRLIKISGSEEGLTKCAKSFAARESQITNTALAIRSTGTSVARLDSLAGRLDEAVGKVAALTQSVKDSASNRSTEDATVTL
mmetsp:Transcript_19190/g.26981  ORF Transcript_19190/g.26981 Transcript_19190/m.26981 type:complete len:119 (+) Transcript_19190:178-534(+)